MTTSNSAQRGAAGTVNAQHATRVRAAAPADLDAVEALLTASDLPLDGVRDALPTFVVAERGTDLVGVAGLEVCCENALLRSVAVRPEWRSHGIGRALVTRVISDAESRGIRALYLLTTTADRYFPIVRLPDDHARRGARRRARDGGVPRGVPRVGDGDVP